MGWFSSESSSTSVSNTYNTNASATQGQEGQLNTAAGGNVLGSGASLTLTDLGAVGRAFDYADKRYASLESSISGIVSSSLSQTSAAQQRADALVGQAASALGAQAFTPSQKLMIGALGAVAVVGLVYFIKRR